MAITKTSLSVALVSIAGLTAAWTPPPEYALFASDDGHYFQTWDRKPFFWQADTAWDLLNRLTYDEADEYLADRASKGFNVVQTIGASIDDSKIPDRLGQVSWVDNSPFKPNDAHYDFVDSVMQRAWEKYGIRIVLHPAWGKYAHNNDGSPGFLNETSARSFGDYIGKRYPYVPKILFGDTNPWWKNKTAVSSDYSYGGVSSAKVPDDYKLIDYTSIWVALAEGFVQGEKATIGGSWNSGLRAGPSGLSSAFFGDQEWLTFDTSQSGHSDYPPNAPIPWWSCRRGWEPAELMYAVGETKAGKKRPALDNEPHYELRWNNAKSNLPYWNASDVRKGNWQTAFTGMAGLTYGANPVWQMTSSVYPGGSGGPNMTWQEAIKLPGSSQVQFVKKAILDRGSECYFNRIPAQDIIVGNAGISDARIAATRDKNGAWLMVYSPNSTFTIDTSSLNGCNVTGSWFSPVTGEYSPFGYKHCDGTKIKRFDLPIAEDHDDWALVLEAM